MLTSGRNRGRPLWRLVQDVENQKRVAIPESGDPAIAAERDVERSCARAGRDPRDPRAWNALKGAGKIKDGLQILECKRQQAVGAGNAPFCPLRHRQGQAGEPFVFAGSHRHVLRPCRKRKAKKQDQEKAGSVEEQKAVNRAA